MMVYTFKCLTCKYAFEVEQPIHSEHKADCPKCGQPAQRVYHPPKWYYDNPKPLYHKDGRYEVH